MSMLEVNNLKKVYVTHFGSNKVKALDNVNLDCILGMKKDKAYHSFLKDYEK